MIEREVCSAREDRLQPRTTDHAAARHEAAGADNIGAPLGFSHHDVENARVEIVVGRKHDHERGRACGKAAYYSAVRASPFIEDEIDCESFHSVRIGANGGERVVVRSVVADYDA